MKSTYLIAVFLFVFQTVHPQSEKLLHGTVSASEFAVSGIDVINQANLKTAVTNFDGKFSILAKIGDVLIIGGKNYTTAKVFIKKEEFEKGTLNVILSPEIIQLAEVEVTKTINNIKIEAPSVSPIRSVDNLLNSPTNTMVHNGSIQDGLNLIAVGKLIGKLFKGKPDDKNTVQKTEAQAFINANFNQDFFKKTLKLQEEEISLFLEFCYADQKVARALENNNILEVTDFLMTKNEEFKKLKG